MKYFLIFIAFAFSFQIHAQENKSVKPKTKIFVRIYDNKNHKVGKGHLLYCNDSTLQLSNRHIITSFPFKEIEIMKTKHGGGHNLLMGTAIGFVTGIAALVLATVVEHGNGVASYNIAFTGFICTLAGVAAGGVAEAFRKSQTFLIDRNTTQWISSRNKLLNLK